MKHLSDACPRATSASRESSVPGTSLSFAWITPWIVGAIAFLIVMPAGILDPTNIAWLAKAPDLQTYYIGWAYFKQSPWTFPLGLNPKYGLELATSIVYSDSNPLFAILFKLITYRNNTIFQYFGFWIFCCFILQTVTAWKLSCIATKSITARISFSILAVFSPTFLYRTGEHINLISHFLILISLYLCLAPNLKRREVYWALTLAAAAAIHGYILGMTLLLWLSDLAGRVSYTKRITARAVLEFVLVLLLLALVTWQAGYFVGARADAAGFGFFRMNLASPFSPQAKAGEVWSYFMPTAEIGPGDYEGFSYFGSGVLALLAVTLFATRGQLIVRARSMLGQQAPFLPIALLFLLLFAISLNIGVSKYNIIPNFDKYFGFGSHMFRASGRFFWPVYYFILLYILYLACQTRLFTLHPWLLLPFALLQIVDTSAGWLPIRQKFTVPASGVLNADLPNPFWKEASTRYDKLRALPPENGESGWVGPAYYALTHGMATDIVYLARVRDEGATELGVEEEARIRTGQYDGRTLYIVRPQKLTEVLASLDRSKDGLFSIDGYVVLAPGWRHCDACKPYEPTNGRATQQ